MKAVHSWLAAIFLAAAETLLGADTEAPGKLDFTIFPTVQYAHHEIFFRTPSRFPPELAATNEIVPGQMLDLLVLVTGFEISPESTAHVSYDLVIHRPDGTSNRYPESVPVAENAKVDDPRMILFPKGVVRYQVEPGDPLGEYRFEVTVHDHHGGGSLTKSAVVRANPIDESFPPPADLDPVKFLSDYYGRPRPSLALPALAALSHTPLAQKKADGLGAVLGFYNQILADNPWLLPHFKKRLVTTSDDGERRIFALVLAFAPRAERPGKDLPRSARRAIEAAQAEPLPIPSREPLTGGQLDALWGQFLASGKYAPVAELVAIAQAYLPHRGKFEAYKKLPTRPKTLPADVRKDAILNSALWSLGSNARQHRLVRNYVVGMTEAKDLAPEMKPVLEAVLAWKPGTAGQGNPNPAVP